MNESILNIWKEIKSSPLYLTFFIGSFLIINIFMFISIFLFHKTFYLANNLGIILTFTFALSVIWKSILTFIVLVKTEKKNKRR
jgi:hypothetical protein